MDILSILWLFIILASLHGSRKGAQWPSPGTMRLTVMVAGLTPHTSQSLLSISQTPDRTLPQWQPSCRTATDANLSR